jgi:hypothetical protein
MNPKQSNLGSDDASNINERQRSSDPLETRRHIESLVAAMNAWFVDVVLPAVFDVESDLIQAGYWNRLDIDQRSSDSGKPNIKSVSLYFYPERTETFTYSPEKIDTATYHAHVVASGNLREIVLSIRFPKRIPPLVEIDDVTLKLEEATSAAIDRFLERFVKGALGAYNSDRMLR